MNTILLTSLTDACHAPTRCGHRRVTEVDDEPTIQAIVAKWAASNGKTGARHSQSRQGVRRKIRRSGLNSSYTQTIIAATR